MSLRFVEHIEHIISTCVYMMRIKTQTAASLASLRGSYRTPMAPGLQDSRQRCCRISLNSIDGVPLVLGTVNMVETAYDGLNGHVIALWELDVPVVSRGAVMVKGSLKSMKMKIVVLVSWSMHSSIDPISVYVSFFSMSSAV